MGVLALGALGAMLPGVVGHGVETQGLIIAVAVMAVVLILAYVTNPSAASFRTFLTELAFRKHLSKLHDASDSEPPALHWARHSHQIDAAPHLQFATRASVSVRSSAHIFRSFGVLTIAAVTPVGDHRTSTKQRNGNSTPANAFASDHGRWFLGAFGKWWFGGALILGQSDDAHTTAGLLDIRLLDDSELLTKWKVVPEPAARRTPPPLPKHASLPLHTPAKQQKHSSPKRKPKQKTDTPPLSATAPATSNNSTTTAANTNIDAHPLITELLQHIATTQSTLSSARAQLAQLHASTAHTREQTEEHVTQRAKHSSTSAVSDTAKSHTHQLTNARRTLRSSEKTLAGVQARHAALEQKVASLTEEAKLLRERVLKDQDRLKEGEEKGRARREEVVEMIGARKEELRRIEEEIVGAGGVCPNSGEHKESIGLAGKVRVLEAEVREAKNTLDELKAWQTTGEGLEGYMEDQEEPNREIEHEKEKEPGVVYIGQTPVRAVSLSNASQTNPSRIHSSTAPHTRTGSGPVSGVLSHIGQPLAQIPMVPVASGLTASNPGHSPTPASTSVDVASPARSARNKGYAIFDPDLAVLGVNTGKGVHVSNGSDSNQAPSKPSPGSTHQATTRPAFSPFDSDTLPIPIPKYAGPDYALGSDSTARYANDNRANYDSSTQSKFSLSSGAFALGLGMESPTASVFSPPPSALLPSSLFSEDGYGHHRWDNEAESDGTGNGQLGHSSSPGQLLGSQFGTSPGQLVNGTSPGHRANGTSPARWEKDADGWVNEAKVAPKATNGWDTTKKPIASGWDTKPAKDSNWVSDLDGWVGGDGRRRWTSESSTNGVWAPRTEGGRPRSVSVESRFDIPIGRPRSDSNDAHRLSTGADSGYHTASNHSHPKKRHSSSSSGDDIAQDGLSFAPAVLQHSPTSGSIDPPGSSFGQGIFGPSSHLSTRRGFDAQRVSLATRVPLIREVEEFEPVQYVTESTTVSNSPPKTRRWFPSVGGKKDDANARAGAVGQGSGLNPDAKVFSFSPDASKMFNFTRGRTFNMAPPAPVPTEVNTTSFSSLSLGSANSSSVALGNGGSSGGSGAYFSSLLAFAPSPAEREALQRALGTNGITRTLSNTSARSPFTSPLASARSSAVDLNDKAALAWGNGESTTPVVQKRTWFPVRKKAAAEETE